VTVGNFYEQFGSGVILRAYEERGLGYDNAIDGLRVIYKGITGVTLKALAGKQRFYMEVGPGIVRGADGEIAFSEAFKSLADAKTKVIFRCKLCKQVPGR
jgi:hypothetical protein